jgi:hypothetical protein
MSYTGLRWWQSNIDADNIGKVFYIFNPEVYNIENLEKANDLIRYCLNLWYQYDINNEKERNALENLERQYYNNKRRIYHFDRFYKGEILRLGKQIENLSLL